MSIAKYELPTAARPESAPYRYAIANMERSYFGARGRAPYGKEDATLVVNFSCAFVGVSCPGMRQTTKSRNGKTASPELARRRMPSLCFCPRQRVCRITGFRVSAEGPCRGATCVSRANADDYSHAAGRRMKLPCVPTGIISGSWQRAGRSRGMFL